MPIYSRLQPIQTAYYTLIILPATYRPGLQISGRFYRTYVRYRIYSTHKQKFHTDNINPKPLLKLKKSQIRIQIHIVSHSSNHPSHLHSPNTIPLPQNKKSHNLYNKTPTESLQKHTHSPLFLHYPLPPT